MAYELAKRTEDAERRLATTDGLPSRNGALLTARLQQRYADRYTVIAPDTPGFGYSDALPGNPMTIAEFGGWIFATSLAITLAPVTAMLLVNLAFGVMTRAAPQLNIFSIGFPLTLVLGMVIVWIGMADILAQYQVFATEALGFLRAMAGA